MGVEFKEGSRRDRNRHKFQNCQNVCLSALWFLGQAQRGQGALHNRQNRHEGYHPQTQAPPFPTSWVMHDVLRDWRFALSQTTAPKPTANFGMREVHVWLLCLLAGSHKERKAYHMDSRKRLVESLKCASDSPLAGCSSFRGCFLDVRETSQGNSSLQGRSCMYVHMSSAGEFAIRESLSLSTTSEWTSFKGSSKGEWRSDWSACCKSQRVWEKHKPKSNALDNLTEP